MMRRARNAPAVVPAWLAPVLVGLVALALVLAPGDRAATRLPADRSPATVRADVTIAANPQLMVVPRSFLGISTEYWAPPIWERRASVLRRVLSLLTAPGNGPFLLRIGGDSADEALWQPRMRKVPEWVYELTSGWLRATAALVRRAPVRLILDLNLLTASPPIAAQWAGAAQAALPPGSIAGLEIGNEPNLYNRQYWLAIVSGTPFGREVLPRRLSTDDYVHDFRAYARVLSDAAPGVPLLGPAVANPGLSRSWFSTLLAGSHPGLGVISAHLYPYSACAAPGTAGFPTIARLLSERATSGRIAALRAAISAAHRGGLPFRLTELNSVTCGGRPGVSNTFATALWAPDALFELLQAGVDGVNVHVRQTMSNTAFSLGRAGLNAHPLLYGLALFARTLGPDAQLVPLSVHVARSSHLKVWAVRVRGGALHVLLINKGTVPVSTVLALPGTGPATVQRLLAPSASSRSEVTLDGQHLSIAGGWLGAPATVTIRRRARGYLLTVPKRSATLLDMRLRPGTLGKPRHR